MAGSPDKRSHTDHSERTTRASDKYPNVGIGITIVVVVLAMVAIAFLFGAFEGEEESAVDETDNTMMGGGVTGAEMEDVVEDDGVSATREAE